MLSGNFCVVKYVAAINSYICNGTDPVIGSTGTSTVLIELRGFNEIQYQRETNWHYPSRKIQSRSASLGACGNGVAFVSL